MKKSTPQALMTPLGFFMSLFLANILLVIIGRVKELNASEWPAWAQGIGSIEAILVAVWVTWHQTESARLADIRHAKEQTTAVLSCIKSEAIAIQKHVSGGIGPLLEAHKKGTPFRYIFPLDADPFPVYRGFIPQLGGVESTVRDQIVQTYSTAQSFVSTFRYHNNLVDQLGIAEEENRVHSTTDARDRVKALELHLAHYSDALVKIYAEAMKATDKLVITLA